MEISKLAINKKITAFFADGSQKMNLGIATVIGLLHGKERVPVDVAPLARARLANLPHREGCVFRRPDGKAYERLDGDYEQSSGGRIKTAFKAACRRAGIKDFHVHDCRHTWASWFYQEHHDFIALQHLGGWKTLSMVTRYAHQNSEKYLDGINAMPSLIKANKFGSPAL